MSQLLQRFLFSVPILLLSMTASGQQFVVDTLVSYPNIASPAHISFAPGDGNSFLFTEKNNGRVRAVERGVLRPTPFVTVSVRGNGSQGLLGITHHYAYPDSPIVYLFYTRSSDGANVVERFTDSAGVGVRPVDILVVPRTSAVHNGGGIHFGPDEKLYVVLGDDASGDNAQEIGGSNLHGKILRLNPDGSIPDDNPWPDTPYWSIGHGQSADLAFDAGTGAMYCTESASSCANALFLVPRGANLGWPDEGDCEYSGTADFVRPLLVFSADPPPGLSGIAVYRGNAFPRMRGEVLLSGTTEPVLRAVTLSPVSDTSGNQALRILYAAKSGITDVTIGPDGNIYMTTGQSASSRVLRLRSVAPAFATAPLRAATQGIRYEYAPAFTGTPPELHLLSGPEGMRVDSTTWRIVWTPTNEQAMERDHAVWLQAANGAGMAEQQFVVSVGNVNDPPGSFTLSSPPADTTMLFVSGVPVVNFAWHSSLDPDRDTLRYTLALDTLPTFGSPALREVAAGEATSLILTLPPVSAHYYWRVIASDKEFAVHSADHRIMTVTIISPDAGERVQEGGFDLKQNFPNPFNPATNIVYTLPRRTYIRLAVFNLLGQEVALIHEGMQEAGVHEVAFRNQDLPSGIYFYRIQSADFVETRKLTILR
jgi:aldose sugar dehydrogenase